jgi:hypothetical protein
MTIKKGDIVLLDSYREAEIIEAVGCVDETQSVRYYKIKCGIFGWTRWISSYSIKALIEARS